MAQPQPVVRGDPPPASLETRKHGEEQTPSASLPSPEEPLREFGTGRSPRQALGKRPRSHRPAPNSRNTGFPSAREDVPSLLSVSPTKRMVNLLFSATPNCIRSFSLDASSVLTVRCWTLSVRCSFRHRVCLSCINCVWLRLNRAQVRRWARTNDLAHGKAPRRPQAPVLRWQRSQIGELGQLDATDSEEIRVSRSILWQVV
jgi:hypothetical protein